MNTPNLIRDLAIGDPLHPKVSSRQPERLAHLEEETLSWPKDSLKAK
jgi:hypothetical protein